MACDRRDPDVRVREHFHGGVDVGRLEPGPSTANSPSRRAAASSANVRSRIRTPLELGQRAEHVEHKGPCGVVVSSASVRLRNATPFSRKASMVSGWHTERARRSSFDTTSVSPSPAESMASWSAGRSTAAPETWSAKILSQPRIGQGIALQREILVRGRDAGVADERGVYPGWPQSRRIAQLRLWFAKGMRARSLRVPCEWDRLRLRHVRMGPSAVFRQGSRERWRRRFRWCRRRPTRRLSRARGLDQPKRVVEFVSAAPAPTGLRP